MEVETGKDAYRRSKLINKEMHYHRYRETLTTRQAVNKVECLFRDEEEPIRMEPREGPVRLDKVTFQVKMHETATRFSDSRRTTFRSRIGWIAGVISPPTILAMTKENQANQRWP